VRHNNDSGLIELKIWHCICNGRSRSEKGAQVNNANIVGEIRQQEIA